MYISPHKKFLPNMEGIMNMRLLLILFIGGSWLPIINGEQEKLSLNTTYEDDLNDSVLLTKRLEQKKELLRLLIAKHPANKKDITHIKKLQKHIQTIEERHGITPLQRQIAALRLESCTIQHTKPEALNLIKQIDQLKEKIDEKTHHEQAETTRLIKTHTALNKSDPRYDVLKKHIVSLQKLMRQKVQKELKAMQKINSALYNELHQKIREVKPLLASIAQKYTEAKSQLTPLDRQIAEYVKNINRRLASHRNQLKQLRTEIRELQKTIIKHDPCYLAKQSIISQDWIHLFI